MNLRFIERDGKKILQHRDSVHTEVDSGRSTENWVDVPLVEEPKKPREFALYTYNANDDSVRAYPREWEAIPFNGNNRPVFLCYVREVLE